LVKQVAKQTGQLLSDRHQVSACKSSDHAWHHNCTWKQRCQNLQKPHSLSDFLVEARKALIVKNY
uniref:CSON013340 protein n=1 Tax=Culicoides sonorensis TaxID=179676 RepID=A0A336NB65_CULSO